jgi:hypothetical protein
MPGGVKNPDLEIPKGKTSAILDGDSGLGIRAPVQKRALARQPLDLFIPVGMVIMVMGVEDVLDLVIVLSGKRDDALGGIRGIDDGCLSRLFIRDEITEVAIAPNSKLFQKHGSAPVLWLIKTELMDRIFTLPKTSV